ncbi:hypothetical protein ACEUZ9_005432 [Paracoccus litorisediminis]|uniref:Uncharacterized protein n=1 Tax=Paracoccus litorisediminis TaxID=2006130 RepID=A0A844HU18_9RHOB|nr:hypothetical protein [Paracoccus litorisediminis]MTH61071.1 hypothetical protein [Paracoccus litorisediminis]
MGDGYTGLSSALHLAQGGYRVGLGAQWWAAQRLEARGHRAVLAKLQSRQLWDWLRSGAACPHPD